MRARLIHVLSAVITMVCIHAAVHAGDAPDAAVEKAAVVNGIVITLQEFEREVDRVKAISQQQGRKIDVSQLDAVRKNVLESFINRVLLYQESKERGIRIPEDEIAKQLDTFKKRFSDEAEYEQTLARMKLTESELSQQIASNLAIQKLINTQIAPDIVISEKAARNYYEKNTHAFKNPEQVKASHILIKVDPEADEKAKAEAQTKIAAIQDRLKKGEDFAALAKDNSQGPSAPKGGDLGYFARGRMVKPFEEAAFAMAAGEVSDVVKTRFGYHLIKVFDKKPAQLMAFEKVLPMITRYLKEKKMERKLTGYLEKLKESAEVERFILDSSKKG